MRSTTSSPRPTPKLLRLILSRSVPSEKKCYVVIKGRPCKAISVMAWETDSCPKKTI